MKATRLNSIYIDLQYIYIYNYFKLGLSHFDFFQIMIMILNIIWYGYDVIMILNMKLSTHQY